MFFRVSYLRKAIAAFSEEKNETRRIDRVVQGALQSAAAVHAFAFKEQKRLGGYSFGSFFQGAHVSRCGNQKFRNVVFPCLQKFIFHYLRKNKRLAEQQDESVADDRKALIDQIIDDEKYRALYRAVELLDDVHREAITLFYFEEQSIKQISDIMNKTEDHVKVILFRARKKLKSLLEV